MSAIKSKNGTVRLYLLLILALLSSAFASAVTIEDRGFFFDPSFGDTKALFIDFGRWIAGSSSNTKTGTVSIEDYITPCSYIGRVSGTNIDDEGYVFIGDSVSDNYGCTCDLNSYSGSRCSGSYLSRGTFDPQSDQMAHWSVWNDCKSDGGFNQAIQAFIHLGHRSQNGWIWDRATKKCNFPWEVTLEASDTSVDVNNPVTLTAIANGDVGPTRFFIQIYENNELIQSCDSGDFCEAIVLHSAPFTGNYIARVEHDDGTKVQATSNSVTVRWNSACVNDCSSGQKRCNSNTVQTCGNYDTDSCFDWPLSTTGSGNFLCIGQTPFCLNGNCVQCNSNSQCNTPPAAFCSGNNRIFFSSPGTCTLGACTYAQQSQNCPNGCQSGQCVSNPCAGITCNTPPANTCASSTKKRVYNSLGTCSLGQCAYTFTDITCTGQTPFCLNGNCVQCNSNSQCNTPPAAFCSGNIRHFFDQAGICGFGACSYTERNQTCVSGCQSGQCILANPCDNVVCNTPPANTCKNETAKKIFISPGSCSSGQCSYSFNESLCTGQTPFCSNAACVECLSNIHCPAGETCVSGNCQSTECTNDCTQGQRRCQQNVSQTCGNYDTDSCLDWPLSNSSNGSIRCMGQTPFCSSGFCSQCIQNSNCNSPPAPSCNGSTRIFFSGNGTCSSGLCSYQQNSQNCSLGCQSGQCVNSTSCLGVTCNSPPVNTCFNSTTRKLFSSPGTCSSGLCSYGFTNIICSGSALFCFNGNCVSCLSNSDCPSGQVCSSSKTCTNGQNLTGLAITDVGAEVDGRKTTARENGEISRNAKPGSKLELDVEVSNLFSRSQDIDIEDIQVKATIEDIDDGSDLEEEAEEFDLRAGNDKNVKFRFELPLNVEDDNFEVLIEAEGEDEFGNSYFDDYSTEIVVEKEKHDLRFLQLIVNPTTIKCSKTININYQLINLGEEDERDASVVAESSELGISFSDEPLSLESGTFNNIISRTMRLNIPDDIENGAYELTISAYGDDGKLKDEATTPIELIDCTKSEEVGEDVVLNINPDSGSKINKTSRPVSSTSYFDFNNLDAGTKWFLFFLILLLAIIIFILVIVYVWNNN